MLPFITATLGLLLGLLVTLSSASASPFYRETFKLCDASETSSKNAQDLVGWKAFRSDSPIGKVGFLKVNLPGSQDHPLDYNSLPVGSEQGAAFWSKKTLNLTLFTEELSFDVSSLALVQYQQRLSGTDSSKKIADGTQLALLIGNTWYISDQTVRQRDRGVWETVSLSPFELTYGTSPNTNGRGPTRPSNFNVKLPSHGIVTAFGVFLSKINDRVRIDNFTLSDLSFETRNPGQQGTADQCTFGGTPTIAPPSPSEGPVGQFCQGRSARALGKVVTSASVRRRLLMSVSTKTLLGKRDKAILSLLLLNRLRIDNLVNLQRQDYFMVGSLPLLNASGVAKQTTPIKAKVYASLNEYLEASILAKVATLPLLEGIDRATDKETSQALCTNDILRIVKRRAHSLRINRQIKIRS